MSTHTLTPDYRSDRQRDVALVVRAAATATTQRGASSSHYGGLVWAVARNHRLSHADAGDVAQCTSLKLVQHLGSLKNPDAVGAWLATTARRECLRIIGGSKGFVPVGDDLPEPPAGDGAIDDELLRDEHDAILRQAVELLRPEDQALVRMLAAADELRRDQRGARHADRPDRVDAGALPRAAARALRVAVARRRLISSTYPTRAARARGRSGPRAGGSRSAGDSRS